MWYEVDCKNTPPTHSFSYARSVSNLVVPSQPVTCFHRRHVRVCYCLHFLLCHCYGPRRGWETWSRATPTHVIKLAQPQVRQTQLKPA